MIKTKFWAFCLLVLVVVAGNFYYTAKQWHGGVVTDAETRLVQAVRNLGTADQRADLLELARAAATQTAVVEALSAAAGRDATPAPEAFPGVVQAVGQLRREGATHDLLLLASDRGISRSELEKPAEHGTEVPQITALQAGLGGTEEVGLAVTADGTLLRVAAAPVQLDGRILGAILLGFRMSDEDAATLRQAVGADVSLVLNQQAVASSVAATQRGQLVKAAASAAPGTTFGWGTFAEELLPVMSLTSPVTGLTPVAGFARKVPLPGLPDAVAILSLPAQDDMARIHQYQLYQAALVAILLFVGFIWSFFLAQGGTGPVRKLAVALEGLGDGERLDAKKYPRPFRSLVTSINGLLDRPVKGSVASQVMTSKTQDISSVLSGTPAEAEQEPEDFHFEGITDGRPEPVPAPAAAAPEPEPEPMAAVAAAQSYAPAPEADPAAFDPFGADDAAGPAAAASAPAPAEEASPFAEAMEDDHGYDQPAGDVFANDSTRVVSLADMQAAAEAAEKPAPAPSPFESPAGDDPFAAAYTDDSGDDEDYSPDATVVAKVPEALLQATARAAAPQPPADPDEAHFREVFREFVATRDRCGEPADGLTMDKFAAKLRKNRDTIKAKHGARSVKFQVYVKEGKAALKATPIK